MKKITIALAALCLVASSAFAERKVDNGPIVITGGALDCTGALSLTCGEVGTATAPAVDNVQTYACTTLDYSECGEAVYEICLGATDDLTVTVTYNHTATNDLDVFLLGSCNEADCLDSSTSTSGIETVELFGAAAGTYYVVVDGWNSGTGGRCDDPTSVATVTCSSPCTPVSVDDTTWGTVKDLYR